MAVVSLAPESSPNCAYAILQSACRYLFVQNTRFIRTAYSVFYVRKSPIKIHTVRLVRLISAHMDPALLRRWGKQAWPPQNSSPDRSVHTAHRKIVPAEKWASVRQHWPHGACTDKHFFRKFQRNRWYVYLVIFCL